MSRKELLDDPGVILRAALRGHQATVWTSLPGFITKYDPATMTCEVQPTVQARAVDAFGQAKWITLPICVDVPVVFPQGGGFALTFPLNPGDEVLISFACRAIDAWWQAGGIGVQVDFRMHDLSDGFAIPGPRSQTHLLPNVSNTDIQLRDQSGNSYFSIDPSGAARIKSPSAVSIEAPNIALAGSVSIDGPVTQTGGVVDLQELVVRLMAQIMGALLAQGTDLHNHQHGGVQNGSSKSGPPVNIVPPLP